MLQNGGGLDKSERVASHDMTALAPQFVKDLFTVKKMLYNDTCLFKIVVKDGEGNVC